ncbi:MAG: hypothetical protein IH971_02845 [Candidatus Marinimicrobia bacterium]|nr:hypothetical protein [Candidatus Neomarinimicrobiota bacterium]
MAKRFLLLGLALALAPTLHAQRDFPFPSDEYFGGGIGYTPTFMMFDLAQTFPFNPIDLKATETGLLGSNGLGFSDSSIAALGNMLVIHGAEGFGNITGNWRVGAYVGLGSKSITRVDTAGLRVDLKLALMTASASIELVIPLFSNLEIAAGSLFGASRAIVQFAKSKDEPGWENQYSFTDIDSSNYAVALSGTFFSFQPYVAVKLQFLNRVGLRVSGGYHVGILPQNQWTLNGFRKIQATSDSNFNAFAVRVMLYMGI